jgi:hypothetical protein
MRPVIRPSLIAFASTDRLASADGDGTQSLSSRLNAVADLLPFMANPSAVRAYHACDLIVTAHNPLLAALALRAASLAGHSAAIALNYGADMWPYDLAVTDEIGHLLASALGMDVPASATGSVVRRIIEQILASLRSDYPVIVNALSPGDRHPGSEGIFFMGEETVPHRPVNPFHESLSSVFHRFMSRRSALATARRGRTVVFARRLLLTGRPEVFGRSMAGDGLVTWDGPVSGLGSARWDLPTYPDAAKAMLEDIITLCRGLPAEVSAKVLQTAV